MQSDVSVAVLGYFNNPMLTATYMSQWVSCKLLYGKLKAAARH
jgi:hypothetical protein